MTLESTLSYVTGNLWRHKDEKYHIRDDTFKMKIATFSMKNVTVASQRVVQQMCLYKAIVQP